MVFAMHEVFDDIIRPSWFKILFMSTSLTILFGHLSKSVWQTLIIWLVVVTVSRLNSYLDEKEHIVFYLIYLMSAIIGCTFILYMSYLNKLPIIIIGLNAITFVSVWIKNGQNADEIRRYLKHKHPIMPIIYYATTNVLFVWTLISILIQNKLLFGPVLEMTYIIYIGILVTIWFKYLRNKLHGHDILEQVQTESIEDRISKIQKAVRHKHTRK